MPVITQGAEDKIQEHLYSLPDGGKGWGLAVMRGSQMELANQRLLRMTESQLVLLELVRDAGLYAYVCDDNDIALLFEGERDDTWPVLRAIFHDMLPHMNPADIDCASLFMLYDLPADTQKIEQWLAPKKDRIRQRTPASVPGSDTTGPDAARPDAVWNERHFARALRSRRQRDRKLIILTEDNRAQRQLAQSILRRQYDVILAGDGIEALEIYNVSAPDMMFLDIQIPHLDGIAVLERVLQHDGQARIVMFSGQSNEDMLRRAIALGAKGFVSKPFTADALIKHAHNALSQAG